MSGMEIKKRSKIGYGERGGVLWRIRVGGMDCDVLVG